MNFIIQTAHSTKNSASAEEFMNIDIKNIQLYAFTELNEWKKWSAEDKCFNYKLKKHWHRNCSTNFYNKIWQTVTINLSVNVWIILNFKIYVLSVNDEVKLSNNFIIEVLISCESKNKLFWNQVAFQNFQSKSEKR